MPNRSGRVANWVRNATNSFVSVATAGPLVKWLTPAVVIPAGAPENDQKEGPEGGYTGCNHDNVALIAVGDLVSWVY